MPNPISSPHDFGDFALSEEGITLAEDMARSAFDHFLASVGIARLDPPIAAVFLACELLAQVQRDTGETPEVTIERFRHIIDERLACDYEADHPASLVGLSNALH